MSIRILLASVALLGAVTAAQVSAAQTMRVAPPAAIGQASPDGKYPKQCLQGKTIQFTSPCPFTIHYGQLVDITFTAPASSVYKLRTNCPQKWTPHNQNPGFEFDIYPNEYIQTKSLDDRTMKCELILQIGSYGHGHQFYPTDAADLILSSVYP